MQALERIRRSLPFALRGIDSDNGSEFINHHLRSYCEELDITFTRGRPYKNDDNAHVEQKNWTQVRKLMGYLRYDSPRALAAMNEVYGEELRVLQNLFLPSVKLLRKPVLPMGQPKTATLRQPPPDGVDRRAGETRSAASPPAIGNP